MLHEQTIANAKLRSLAAAGREFDDREGRKRDHDSTRLHISANLDHHAVACHRNDIDRKPHPEGMHTLARCDHERVKFGKTFTTEQTLFSGSAVAGNLDRFREAHTRALHGQHGAGPNTGEKVGCHLKSACKNRSPQAVEG